MDVLKTFGFTLPTRIEYGVGSITRLSGELSLLSSSRPLLITDKGLVASGLASRVTRTLAAAGVACRVFDETAPNPRDENVSAAALLAREIGCDCLIALGGGSSIDCAKGVSILALHDGTIQDYRGVENVPGATLPLIAIPTTAGSGSEVTFSSVLSDTRARTKFSLRSVKIAPRVSICDPELSVSMPGALTAATGMDALTHAIEGYTALAAEPFANATALYSIELIAKYLRRAVADGTDVEARAGMLTASLLAAVSFSHSDVAAVHCIAESLGGMYDKSHGVCNAVCLPEVMDYNKGYCTGKYARVAQAMGAVFGSDEEGALAAVEEVRRLSRDVGIPAFSELAVPESEYREVAAKSAQNLSNGSNPRPLGADDYMAILQRLAAM